MRSNELCSWSSLNFFQVFGFHEPSVELFFWKPHCSTKLDPLLLPLDEHGLGAAHVGLPGGGRIGRGDDERAQRAARRLGRQEGGGGAAQRAIVITAVLLGHLERKKN